VLITIGMVLGGGAMIYLTQLTPTSSYAGGVLPSLLVMGLGFGMIIAPAINTATAGVSREDSGVASALVNTMQQVGGSIGTSALSTIALTATASYLVAHHTGRLAAATAATHGYTVAFAVSAGLFGLGVVLAIVLLPSKLRLQQLREAASAGSAAPSGRRRPARLSLKHRLSRAGADTGLNYSSKAFASSIQVCVSCSERPTTAPCRSSIISFRCAALR
jgi:hypothetical protein